ncbi:class F sortase [Cellulomonas sp. WB94]|uniref:class F sortase n=1 Tax=Cellulomonas sp. WB94 TaxID=2173174 RepID=UPI000D568C81|nr:class F sortase [Cellulomonas sp. WB94]PVU82578.1 class F sortase [Cellulomonas sp. WB94]
MRHHTERLSPRHTGARVVARGALIAAITFAVAGCSGPAGSVPSAPLVGPSVLSPSAPSPSDSSPSVAAPSVPAPTPVEAPHLAKSKPVRLHIPAVGVDSPLMDLGLKADGTMEVPPSGFPAGWYTGAPTPGELGPAIIAGHVDWKGPGVFYRLRNLKPGDTVSVTREDGSIAAFRVTRVEQFAKDTFPTDLVYGNIDVAGLRLITCGGSWNAQTHHYDDNIIAFADFVPPGS